MFELGRVRMQFRLARAVLFAMLELSPIRVDTPSIDPPPAAVLPIGETMPGLDPWVRRSLRSLAL